MRTFKILGFMLIPVAVCIGFAGVFYAHRGDFSLSDVNKPQNLDRFLARYFSEVCSKAVQPDGHYVETIRRGCSYHYVFPALVDNFNVMVFPDNPGNEYRFSFQSYFDGVLKIKYFVGPLFPKNMYDEYQEHGLISMDLSRFEKPGDDILIQFTPHVPFNGYLVKALVEQPPFDEMVKKKVNGWGTILGLGLLSLGSQDPNKGNPSMTVGREQAYFITSSSKSSYEAIRDYFEKGSMEYFGFFDFVYFSAAVLTSSALGDMVPMTLTMKMAVSLESLLGIMWLGIAAGWAFELWREYSK
ncbi:ion channel [Bdellovibrio sp. HCB117]|uniref:ion channel n=1 Tax=Bdellovibrio sp. HCB117 TaxID=3394359 RepID=UPI0039B46919